VRALNGIALFLVALSGCQRENRQPRPTPADSVVFHDAARESSLQPGGKSTSGEWVSPYEANAYAVSEGQRLFDVYNCSGCHAHGGGGIGPPLIKQQWIYGGEPANLFDTIVKGRPNGMPTWGGKIPEYQIWQLVAFIRSMNHEEPQSATPARSDTIQIQPSIHDRVNGVTR
jgi:cytochrome c oxidase cbb3-type subunit 3